MITILHIIEALGRGGAERRLLYDVSLLNRQRYRSVVCHLYPPCEFPEVLSAGGISPVHLEMNGLRSWGGVLSRLNQLVKTYEIDVIHTQLFWADLVGRIAGKWNRIPVVTTIQSSVYEPGIDYFRSSKRFWLDRLSGRFCNARFVAVSEFVKQSAVRRLGFPEGDIQVIHNTIDFREFSPTTTEFKRSCRIRLGVPEETVLLLTVGKLNPPKSIDTLLKLLPGVVEKFPNVLLYIIGDGPQRGELEEMTSELKLKAHVRFFGQREDVPAFLGAGDLFLLPTLSEGFPISLLEAVATALPCLASDIGPIRELLGVNSPSLVPPADPEAWRTAVLRTVENLEGAKRHALHQREILQKRFNLRENVLALERLYEAVVGEKEKRRL